MCYTIQPIQESDFEELTALFQEMADFQGHSEKMVNSVAKMKREKAYIMGFTAKDPNGRIAGYATCFFAYYTWRGKCLYMDDLFVHADYRKRGLGKALLRKVIDFAKENECHKVRWMVATWNENAIRVYESIGAVFDRGEMACDLNLE